MKKIRTSSLLVLLSLCSGCGFQRVTPNSSGNVDIQGDETLSQPLEGLGIGKVVSGSSGSVCLAQLFDRMEVGRTPAVKMSLHIFPGKLAAYPTGSSSLGPDHPEGFEAFVTLTKGFKSTEHTYKAVSGTLTVERFDAERFAGSLTMQAERGCTDVKQAPPYTCTSTIDATFDLKNADCFPPL